VGGSRCAFVQGEIRIVGFTEGSKSAIIDCLTVSILQWFTREQAHTCLTLVRLLTESCIYKNLLAFVLWISGSPVKQVGHLRGIDLLQDPIDPKELVSSLRTKVLFLLCPQITDPAISPGQKWWRTVLKIEISCSQWDGSACSHGGPWFGGGGGGGFCLFFLVQSLPLPLA